MKAGWDEHMGTLLSTYPVVRVHLPVNPLVNILPCVVEKQAKALLRDFFDRFGGGQSLLFITGKHKYTTGKSIALRPLKVGVSLPER